VKPATTAMIIMAAAEPNTDAKPLAAHAKGGNKVDVWRDRLRSSAVSPSPDASGKSCVGRALPHGGGSEDCLRPGDLRRLSPGEATGGDRLE